MPTNYSAMRAGTARDLRWSQALWYAWGWQDAGQPLPDDAFAFAEAYTARYQEYGDGRTGMMPSMQEAFANWIFGRPM
jgi:hypothetical protein